MKALLPVFVVLLLSQNVHAQISNDYCYNAIEIVLAPEGYGQMYSGYYAMATASFVGGNSCGVAPDIDFWYKFVATSSTLKLTNNITNGSFSLLTVYKNSCHNLEEIHCQQSGTTYVTHLVVGDIYYIKAQKSGTTPLFFSFKAEEGIHMPNGLCQTAEPVLAEQGVCGNNYYFSPIGQSGVAKPSCVPVSNVYDVWFQVVAPPSGCIEIIASGGNNLYATTYTNDCNALTEFDCFAYIISDPFLTGLTPGETYLIRLYSNTSSNVVYDVCFKEGPMPLLNDECSSSITLSIPSTCVEVQDIDIFLATKSSEPHCSFSTQYKKDVWYNFVAPATGNVVIENTSTPNFYLALYEGECGNLSTLNCLTSSLNESYVFSNLDPDSTYTLRILLGAAAYLTTSFCLYEGEASPAFDECASAINLTVQSGTCSTVQSLDWTYLTPSGEDTPCNSSDEPDAWFSFTAPASGNIEFSGLTNFITKTIYSGTCGSLVPEVCVKGKYVSGLVPNEDYFLLLSQPTSISTSNFCLLEYTIASINNACSNATLLANNSTFVPNWASAAYETDEDNSCDFRPHDVWYSFVAPTSGSVKFSGPTGSIKSFEVYEGNCGSLTQITCFSFPGTSGSNFIVNDLDAGMTYFVRIYHQYHYNLHTQTYSFYDDFFLVNNNCDGATGITPIINCTTSSDVNVNFTSASLSDVPLPDCITNPLCVDLWYSFNAPSSGIVQYEDNGILGYIALYENSCGALNLVYCGLANTVILDSLIQDTTYLLRIISTNRNATSFCLVKLDPEENSTTCASPASGILFGDNECGPLVEFDMSAIDPLPSALCGDFYAYWFEIVIPPSGSFNFQLFEGPLHANIAFYEGTCENLTELYCSPIDKFGYKFIDDLVGGQTYLLRFSTAEEVGDVKFCVAEISPPSEESTCTEALDITESTNESCDQIISGSTIGAGQSAGAFCGANMTNAVFYTFTPATSASYSIVLSNAPATHRITVFENCALQSPLTCGLMETIASFMAGTTYIIAVYPENNSMPSAFDLCLFKPDPASMSGSVGINVPNPQTRLDVNGGIKPGYSEDLLAGNIRWTTDLEVYDGISWKSLIGWDYQASENINMLGHQIKNLNTPIAPNDAATKQYVDNQADGDSDPNNEFQQISKTGNVVTLSDGGGSFTDDVDDADNNTSNELQTISKVGTIVTLSHGGGSFTDAVNDADSDPGNEIETWTTLAGIPTAFSDNIDNVDDADNNATNELQTISKTGSVVTLSNGGGNFTDAVNDADNNPNNELQTISKSGSIVTLSNGGGNFTDAVNDADSDPANEIETWSTLAGIPSGFLDGIDNGGAFTRNGNLVVNAGNHDLEDFAFGSNVLPSGSSISDTLFFFDKSKGAFRSGRVFNSKDWAPDSIGLYSFATGSNVAATGNYSFAGGELTKVSGLYAVGMGYNVNSHGESSTAFGYKTDAIGDFSLAAGNSTNAIGDYSTSFGLETTSYGRYATALGLNTIAESFASVALGRYNIGGGNPTSWIGADPLFEVGNGTSSTASNALTILKNGYTGIGIATPLAPLHIEGNSSATIPLLRVAESVAGDGARISFTNTAQADNRWTLYGLVDNTHTNSVFNIFYNGIGNIITANGEGNVGIKGSPTADLHIYHNNNAGASGLKLENNSSTDWMRFYISSGNADLRLYSKSQGASNIGYFDDVSGAYVALSDKRVKMNAEDLYFSWDDFMRLKPLSYQFKAEKTGKRAIGMFAQEVQSIYPEMVSFDEAEDLYHLDYAGFGVVAIKAIQEQQKIIDDQARIIADQEERLLKVEALLKSLLEK